MMRLFLISLGVTCLASVILFLYFRNRVGRMEQKVDLMFQLIQEYEQTKNIAATRQFEPAPIPRNDEVQTGGHMEQEDLISVSDDDDDHETDSEEISDNEDEEQPIHIQESVENIKSISLSGAEIESKLVEPGDDLDEISDLDDNNDVITLEETNPTEMTNLEDEQTDVEEEIIDEIVNNPPVSVKKIEVVDEKPLAKMTVKELKLKAEQDGFTNFKGLRKDKLVELLQSH